MEINTINYYSLDGWEHSTEFNHTPSSMLHIPRIGDHIKNKYGNTYVVYNVVWNIANNSIDIYVK